MQADPYLLGVIIPMQDEIPESSSKVSSKVVEVREAIYNLNSLEIKLKVALCLCACVACKCTHENVHTCICSQRNGDTSWHEEMLKPPSLH